MNILIFAVLVILSCGYVGAQQSIDTARYRDFDFWLGEWNVYNKGDDTIRAHSSITKIISGFGVEEHYRVLNGPFTGKSLNTWNPRLGKWEQFWIDNSGNVLKIMGGLDEEGRMVMGNSNTTPSGLVVMNEVSWQALEDGTVDQIWRLKQGEGEWQIVFDGIYKKRE